MGNPDESVAANGGRGFNHVADVMINVLKGGGIKVTQ